MTSRLRLALMLLVISIDTGLGGCTVFAIADTVGSVAVSAVGVAADAAIGTVKVAGKVVGKAADAVTGSSTPAASTPSK